MVHPSHALRAWYVDGFAKGLGRVGDTWMLRKRRRVLCYCRLGCGQVELVARYGREMFRAFGALCATDEEARELILCLI